MSSYQPKVIAISQSSCFVDVKNIIAGMVRVVHTPTGRHIWAETMQAHPGMRWHFVVSRGVVSVELKLLLCYNFVSLYCSLGCPNSQSLCHNLGKYLNDKVLMATSSFSLTTDKYWCSLKVTRHWLIIKKILSEANFTNCFSVQLRAVSNVTGTVYHCLAVLYPRDD